MAANITQSSSTAPVAKPLARETANVRYGSASNGSQGLGPEAVVADEATLEKGEVAVTAAHVDNAERTVHNMAWWLVFSI